jgi:hypothetical protein
MPRLPTDSFVANVLRSERNTRSLEYKYYETSKKRKEVVLFPLPSSSSLSLHSLTTLLSSLLSEEQKGNKTTMSCEKTGKVLD